MTSEIQLPNRPTVIEFIGMPGSGKTTLARSLHRRLAEGDNRVLLNAEGSAESNEVLQVSRGRRNLMRLRTILSHAGLASSVLLRVRNEGTASELWRLTTREVRRKALGQAAEDVVILDEGPLHKLCMLYAEDLIQKPRGLMKHLTKPTLLVALEIGPQQAISRIHARQSSSPVDVRPVSELRVYLKRYAAFQALLLREVACDSVVIDSAELSASATLSSAVLGYLEAVWS